MRWNGTSRTLSLSAAGDLPSDTVLFGQSAAMHAVRQKAEKVCKTTVPILLQGEGGTGKEVLAKWIHTRSPFSSGPFIKVNCAAIPPALLESELFGYEKGAFTGALAAKPGRLELADQGTLFLDDIADLDMGLQAKMLQFLQDGRFTRIGGEEERYVETRVICATNRVLEQEIETGNFRPDLYYRVNVVQIDIPPLRDRREDIELLADHFLQHYNAEFERNAPPIGRELMHLLRTRDWLGNIRELENRIARYVILGADDIPDREPAAWRPPRVSIEAGPDGSIPLKRIAREAIREMETDLIHRVLQDNRWNRRKAAEVLKISYRALIYKIRQAGLASNRGVQKGPAAASRQRTSAPLTGSSLAPTKQGD